MTGPVNERKASLNMASRPRLARGVRMREDKVRGRTVLLAPERTVALDETGIAILNQLDGKSTLRQVIDTLAETYDAPADVIEKDVVAFLDDLGARRFLEFES
ncbi:pyrroloquinoline quinone biosynthesis peptide chaperone PqqD [Oricola cellulosilytica]|uniref:Pyrroloquinoline quinone biosynthesis peptide chaperone PqqD n=1 Tax=Oricola cellulosilytica TaxID=1429082 RepID=A0A4R0P8K6_9HYPH|nr:pyrroloquinoline quinone biosynthesis peptide chaperone PqqD [Oricola cellulosilytica]TCD13404.1 pyrroloquinoline quinone biosynthesis peptide chaperone PqqD [Oricola cellulosilytica]